MKVKLFVLRKHILYFLFWWNIWRNMTSDTRLFRVLLLKSKHTEFSYTCVGWINRSQDNLFMFYYWRSSEFAETFFCFFNFCPKILNTLHQIVTTFQILREYSSKAKVSRLFPDKPSKELKTVDVMWTLNYLCCRKVFLFSCCNILSDTPLFRILLLKSNLTQSYTCVDWSKRSQDNLFMDCCWRTS